MGPAKKAVASRRSTAPSCRFDLVKKYLGPGGLFAQTEQDGWWIVGCLIEKK
jgi:hypothetical protein